MSSMGGQWRVLRHYLSANNLNAELDKIVQRLRPVHTPEQWDNFLKKLEKVVSLRIPSEQQAALSSKSGTMLSSVDTQQALDAPSQVAEKEKEVPSTSDAGTQVVDTLTPPVDTNALPSHVKDISWEGLLQGLRLKKDLHFGNIVQPSWKSNKPIVSKSSIECRTSYVVSAVGGAVAAECVRKRVDDLVHHLHTYPDATDYALKEGAVRALLRVRRRLRGDDEANQEARAAIREGLALLGWAGAPGGRAVRVLALDGGGVRGLAALALLTALQQHAGRPVHEMFDLVVGVSTGAIIAAIIGSGVGDLDTASRMYVTLSREMFGNTSIIGGASRLVWNHSYYDTEAWERMLRDKFGEVTLTQCSRRERPRLALVSVCRGPDGRAAPFVFRSYRAAGEGGAPRAGTAAAAVWAAVRASAAAPTYFTEYAHGGALHQDGGLLVNNPAGVALQEARRVWGAAAAHCLLVSAGTGRAPPAPPAPPAALTQPAPASWKDKFNTILDSATDTEGVHLLLNDLLPADSYFRFNPPLTEPCAMDEIDPDKIRHMMDDTHAYIRRNHHKLSRAAQLLSAPRSLVQRCSDALYERAVEAGLAGHHGR